MKYLKHYNFDNYVDNIKSIVDRESDVYNKDIETQFSIDLFYDLKWTINDYLKDKQTNSFVDNEEDEYKKRIFRDIDGILYKYSKHTYHIIKNLPLVSEIMWKYINKTIPYNDVENKHHLQDHIFNTVTNIIKELKSRELFDI